MKFPLSKIPADFNERISIVHSIAEPLESLTVREICERNGITHGRFYSLFPTKSAIADWYFSFMFSMSLDEIGRLLTWEEGISSMVDMISKERRFITALYENFEQRPPAPRIKRAQMRQSAIMETLALKGEDISPGLNLQIEAYLGVEATLARIWATSPELDRDDFVHSWMQCIPHDLKNALERPHAAHDAAPKNARKR